MLFHALQEPSTRPSTAVLVLLNQSVLDFPDDQL